MMFLLYASVAMLFYLFIPYYNKIQIENGNVDKSVLTKIHGWLIMVQGSAIALLIVEILLKSISKSEFIIYISSTFVFIIISFILNMVMSTFIQLRYLINVRCAGYFTSNPDHETLCIVVLVAGGQAANVGFYNYINVIT